MKYISIITMTFLLLISITCGSSNSNKDTTYSGIIESTGITSYQYGTHILKTDDNFFALKSNSVELKQFEGKTVTLTAEKIKGYPVDGGPVYLNVTKILND